MPKDSRRNRVGVAQVTSEQIEQMAAVGVSADITVNTEVAERAGSDDKVEAVTAEGAKPKVPTYKAEDLALINSDPYGLRVQDIYGVGKGFALLPEMIRAHAQVVGSLNATYMNEVIHGPDPSAPAFETLVCVSCSKPATKPPIRTAMIDRQTGELVRDRKTGVVIYRGQFVTNGPDGLNLPVHFAHLGKCMYKPGPHPGAEPTGLRVKRDHRTTKPVKEFYTDRRTGQERWRWALLDAQSFDQANVRVVEVRASIQAKIDARKAESEASQAESRRQAEALGFKVGDVARHTSGSDKTTMDRGVFEPKTPRGQHRKQRRWIENEDAS